jgi:hypothetical protein
MVTAPVAHPCATVTPAALARVARLAAKLDEPEIVRAVRSHLAAFETFLRDRLMLRVEIRRSYRITADRGPVITLRFTCDPQSEQLAEDQLRVWREARSRFISAHFMVRPTVDGAKSIVLDGYYGPRVAP